MITVSCNHQTHKATTGSMRCSPMETRLLRNSEAIALFLPHRIATIHTLEYLNAESDCEACTTLLQTRNHPQHPSPRSTLVMELMPAGNGRLLNLDSYDKILRKILKKVGTVNPWPFHHHQKPCRQVLCRETACGGAGSFHIIHQHLPRSQFCIYLITLQPFTTHSRKSISMI